MRKAGNEPVCEHILHFRTVANNNVVDKLNLNASTGNDKYSCEIIAIEASACASL